MEIEECKDKPWREFKEQKTSFIIALHILSAAALGTLSAPVRMSFSVSPNGLISKRVLDLSWKENGCDLVLCDSVGFAEIAERSLKKEMVLQWWSFQILSRTRGEVISSSGYFSDILNHAS